MFSIRFRTSSLFSSSDLGLSAMTVPFQASRLKIWRARFHLESLNHEISEYMSRKPAHVNIRPAKPPKDAGMVYREVHVTEPIPYHLAAVVGDFIHNLRTALDLLACDLVRMEGKGVDNVYFPFAKNADDIDLMIERRNFNRAAPEVVEHLRRLKPYVGGNAALRGVHDLDVIDKHQALILTHGRIKIPYSDGNPIIPSSSVQFAPLNKHNEPHTGILSSGHTRADKWPIGEGLPVNFDITFPQDVPFAAQPVIPWCEGLVEEISGIIDSFETLCFGTVSKEFPWT